MILLFITITTTLLQLTTSTTCADIRLALKPEMKRKYVICTSWGGGGGVYCVWLSVSRKISVWKLEKGKTSKAGYSLLTVERVVTINGSVVSVNAPLPFLH